MIFYYDGGYVTLRNPELGDIRRINTYAESRETIGGELKSVKDSGWPNKQIRAFVVSSLTQTIAEDFRDALEASAGLQVKITDHNNEVWVGVVISNPNDIITQSDQNCGRFDVAFEMMCEYDGVPTAVLNTDEEQIYNTDEEPINIV